jgi:hypothetical protein
MDDDDTELKPGVRICLSALGKARSPRQKFTPASSWVMLSAVACASYWMAAKRRSRCIKATSSRLRLSQQNLVEPAMLA